MLCKNCKTVIENNLATCPICDKFPYIKDDFDSFKEKKYIPAIWWKRLLNYIFDLIFIFLFLWSVAMMSILLSEPIMVNSSPSDKLFTYLGFIMYYFITESIFSNSFSKYITRTYTIGFNGEKPLLKNTIIRSILRIIPFEQLSFLSNRPVGLHDFLSKTLVVEKINKIN